MTSGQTTAWMICSYCQGHGLVYGYMGEPVECGACEQSGIERARDSRGRFARIAVTDPHAVNLHLDSTGND